MEPAPRGGSEWSFLIRKLIENGPFEAGASGKLRMVIFNIRKLIENGPFGAAIVIIEMAITVVIAVAVVAQKIPGVWLGAQGP